MTASDARPPSDGECSTPGCRGDGRYVPPGRGHQPGCTHLHNLPVGRTLPTPTEEQQMDETHQPEWEQHRCRHEIDLRNDIALRCNLALGHPGDHQTGFSWGPDGYRGNG